MHPTSYQSMQKFVADYGAANGKVLDVGSMDINGTYKPLFKDYTGLDLHPGKNVDLVGWKKVDKESFDFVISGQTLEHVKDDKGLVENMVKALKKGGKCCVIVPADGPKHNEPDFRRYTKESLSELLEDAGLKIIETRQSGVPPWFDVTVVAEK